MASGDICDTRAGSTHFSIFNKAIEMQLWEIVLIRVGLSISNEIAFREILDGIVQIE